MPRIPHTEQLDFPPIGSLSALGDGQSMALVAPDGTVEWFCPGRFDAPPVFWTLLDRNKGGQLRIAPRDGGVAQVRYLDDTAVAEYLWETATGTVRAALCMEWPAPAGSQRLLWSFEVLNGSQVITVDYLPRPDFGCSNDEVVSSASGLAIRTGSQVIRFQGDCSLGATSIGWTGSVALSAGQKAMFALAVDQEGGAVSAVPSGPEIASKIDATADTWRTWCATLKGPANYRSVLVRSAITLKMLIYAPTGAVVAAATSSLPEELGGERNWDYRYTWFRDAGLTLDALFDLGYQDEAHRWAEWMQRVIDRHGLPLNVLYTIDGLRLPKERTIEGVSGYRNSRPVRVGNAADRQFQLDIYGELLECVYICDSMSDDAMLKHWSHLRAVADFIARHWRKPDRGIWEVRSEPQQYVHSKVMAWAGMQRALWLLERHGLEGDAALWRRESDALRSEVLANGLSQDGRYFVRSYGGDDMDASLLLLARTGFIDGHDELFRNTVNRVRERLQVGEHGMIRRYLPDQSDGLRGIEGAFVICSFWLVQALVSCGQRQEAVELFEQLYELRGDTGLYAEEMSVDGSTQLGNFPQAFSHVGVINAVLALYGDSSGTEASPLSRRSPSPT
ncbi:MAG TPA: glycoside hydrolase family 15 protein [Pseudomonas xinjiangensis]|uniref:Glycoside hydrolase family 15 protein n=2 Tax=root TaxID=1 RepID=A0A7V1FRF3_9GAMM|nr:glycoside hydrolase family 15 protein [Halopseudomonas xinjiangensis]HEC47553.1 glycoside hydrolase family 15 protein [Halopseudomonas xinjiangensis]